MADSYNSSRISPQLCATATLGYLFLCVPLIILVVYSFNDSRINVQWIGFTLRWYRILFTDTELIYAALNSLMIACISSTVAVVLGTMAGVALYRYKLRVLSWLIMIPIATPELFIGVSLLLFFILINFELGNGSIILAHIAFCLSFVALSVKARMYMVDESIFDAARDLGASPFIVFYKILIPIILPGIAAGWLMAFTLSIDDFVITFFTAGIDSTTLPIAIYSMIKMGVTPEINAASTVIIIVTLMLTTISMKMSPQVV